MAALAAEVPGRAILFLQPARAVASFGFPVPWSRLLPRKTLSTVILGCALLGLLSALSSRTESRDPWLSCGYEARNELLSIGTIFGVTREIKNRSQSSDRPVF